MQPDEKTQKVAEGVTKTIDTQDSSIPAPQPAPAGMPPVAPAVASAPTPAAAPAVAEAPANPDSEKQPESEQEPEAKSAITKPDGPELTSNHKVRFVIIGGALLFLIGILLAVFSFVTYGIVVVLAAAIIVLLGVFLPIR